MKPDMHLVETLHRADKVFRKAKAREDWSQWWASYLLDSTDFNLITERKWQKDELAEALRALKSTYERQKPKQHWAHFYALRLSN